MKKLMPYLMAGVFVAGSVLVSTGCVARVKSRGHVRVDNPQLVYVGPGVWVVEDHHQPVFYSDGNYWLYRGGVWYRSGYYNRGWVRARVVPRPIRTRIHRPRTYVRYRAKSNVRRRPVVRDHRRAPSKRAAPPRTRDHRRVPATRNKAPRKNHRDHRDHRRSKPKARPQPKKRSAPRDHRKKKKSNPRTRDHRDD